ncbi:MAG: glycoside hydrolase N-terminal domain-containing protein [Tannerellaceae bacterium]|jgi:alpha-L-fucosidase 2|nr:glycoside hydrolase N-terminal domain-containing protein [Tannerellaceae bacterium]
MEKRTLIFVSAIACMALCSCSGEKEITVDQVEMNWWYDAPATKYWEGLPIGTGRFGAMIPGSVGQEVIAFNDETLWTGGPYNPNNPEGPEILKRVREQAFAHNWVEADREAWKLSSIPPAVQYYQPMGRLHIRIDGHEPANAAEYRRSLSMDSALVNISYLLDDVCYTRTVFASYPDQVIVLRFTADKKGMINLSNWFTSLQPSAVTRVEKDEIIMEGTTIAEKEGEPLLPPQMRWQSRIRVIPDGGVLSADGDRLTVKDADAVTLILAGATNWVNWNDVSADEKKQCAGYLSNAAALPYPELLERHLADYCPLFAACRINLGAAPDPTRTTTQSMEAIRRGDTDPAYEARYFQYGRYLMLAASRENTLAFNNHNIWLDNLEGRWRGRWTLNINLQQCFWPVESANLPVVNESLVSFVENLAEAGQRTARELYGCRGWCAHHGTDVWFNTAPTDGNPMWATYPVAGFWLMQQLYEHYLYNPDTDYLRRIYPLLEGAVAFCLDFLVENPETGYLVTCPASSPENRFVDDNGNRAAISFGSSGDTQIVRKLLRNFADAARILQLNDGLKQQAEEAIDRLPPHRTGRFGQLQEWIFDFKENEVTHRHLSHLFAAYPDDDITPRKTPELADAVRVVLQRRGDINMGWSGAWKINLHARLEEPAKAYAILHKMLTDISIHPLPEDSQITPSFEGNQAIQGVTAGMAEMLLQSHSGELSLLPALPAQWSDGAVEGLRAKGGFEVAMAWRNGILSKATIKANRDAPCRLRTKTPVTIFSAGKSVPTSSPEENLLVFNAQAGNSYYIVNSEQ